MKFIYFVLLLILLSGCHYVTTEISGTAHDLDGSIVSLVDIEGKTVCSSGIKNGKFDMGQTRLKETGYYTLSVFTGKNPRDFDIYIEAGKYTIEIPPKESDYLIIKTNSKTQNDLSAYYTFEDSLMYSFHHEVDSLNAQVGDPKNSKLSGSEFDKLLASLRSAKARERGAKAAIMDMFVEKHPQNTTVIPHVISNEDYISNPMPYYYVFNKLSPAVKNTDEGKEIGKVLDSLNKAPGNP